MKRLFVFVLAVLLALFAMSLSGCEKKSAAKFGMGCYGCYTDVQQAGDEGIASCTAELNIAAVLLDKAGRIVRCDIDCASNDLSYTIDGKYIVCDEYFTKNELRNSYGLANNGGSAEWYQQVENFCCAIIGKTVSEVKASVASDGKGDEEIIATGCTIKIDGFVKAIERAASNARSTTAMDVDRIHVGVVTLQTNVQDATESTDGISETISTFAAAALNEDGKVSDLIADSARATVTFNSSGGLTSKTGEIKTRREQKNGTEEIDGLKNSQWAKQIALFEKDCAGKNAAEMLSICDTGFATGELKKSGCTMDITDITDAAFKAATIN